MMVIAVALQERLFAAANRHLGASGEVIVRVAAQRGMGIPLEEVSYAHLPALLAALEQEASRVVGHELAFNLAAALDGLRVSAESGLSEGMVDAVSAHLGPAARSFLTTVCAKLGLSLAGVERRHLAQIAATAGTEASALLGAETAYALAAAVREAGSHSAGVLQQVGEVVRAHAGEEGERIVRELCHQRLEIDLDQIDLDGIAVLAETIRRDGPERLGAAPVAAFLIAARQAVAGPGMAVRTNILKLVNQHIGPAGPLFLKNACAREGVPFDAVGYEHLTWLAGLLGQEAVPLVGANGAAALTGAVLALQPAAR